MTVNSQLHDKRYHFNFLPNFEYWSLLTEQKLFQIRLCSCKRLTFLSCISRNNWCTFPIIQFLHDVVCLRNVWDKWYLDLWKDLEGGFVVSENYRPPHIMWCACWEMMWLNYLAWCILQVSNTSMPPSVGSFQRGWKKIILVFQCGMQIQNKAHWLGIISQTYSLSSFNHHCLVWGLCKTYHHPP